LCVWERERIIHLQQKMHTYRHKLLSARISITVHLSKYKFEKHVMWELSTHILNHQSYLLCRLLLESSTSGWCALCVSIVNPGVPSLIPTDKKNLLCLFPIHKFSFFTGYIFNIWIQLNLCPFSAFFIN